MTTNYIEVPQQWETSNDYDSHRPALWLALEHTARTPVTEFGCGYGSTDLINRYCKKNSRFLFSYETNQKWADKFDCVTVIKDYMEVHLSDKEWKQGVVFVDCAPGELRKELIAKHAMNAEVIVVHDSEPGAEYVYGLSPILSTFKYRLDYAPEGKPWTTAVSNFIDVTKWISQ